jgi:hypothetical protein
VPVRVTVQFTGAADGSRFVITGVGGIGFVATALEGVEPA